MSLIWALAGERGISEESTGANPPRGAPIRLESAEHNRESDRDVDPALIGKRKKSAQSAGLDLTQVVALDVETTGLSPKNDRVVELALVGLNADGQVDWTWHSLFDPGCPIPSEASAIHGIDNSRVKGAPAFAERAGAIAKMLENGVLLAHNLNFDIGFLRAEFQRSGKRLPARRGIDTLKISRRADKGERSHTLTSACKRYRVRLDKAHQATTDTVAAAQLLVAMRDRHGNRSNLFTPSNLS